MAEKLLSCTEKWMDLKTIPYFGVWFGAWFGVWFCLFCFLVV